MQHDTALMPLGMTPVETGATEVPPDKRVPRRLDGREKAAVIVRLLLTEGADIPIEDLPEDLQEILTHQMAGMGLIDRLTLDAVAHEFVEALEGVGLSFPHGIADALTAMDGKITPGTAARLRRAAGVQQTGDPWPNLRKLDAAELAGFAQSESTEVAAVLLSKLDTPKAAELLGLLPGPVARRITYAISRTTHISPDAVDRIGRALLAQSQTRPPTAFEDRPEKRVGEILNQSPSTTRDQMLTALDEEDADFATSVRKVLFTFADIARRIAPKDATTVARAVEQDVLVTALVAASEPDDVATAEFLLSNMTSRMADALREEMAEKGKVKQAAGEQAMTTIVAAIRTLEQEGGLTLLSLDEEEEDG
ncbi:flagellar motor switch protein FliG [Ruegeria jejuensis]|uniref:flagellar motor switch protein FliG n=1 Tax=Ruegeria jejuensis TaxID=3233338 RepID=UPI00355B1A43